MTLPDMDSYGRWLVNQSWAGPWLFFDRTAVG